MSYEEDIAFGVQQMLDADLQFPQRECNQGHSAEEVDDDTT